MADFGLEKQPVEEAGPSNPSIELASTFANALRAKRKVQRRVDSTKWAKYFESLLKEHPRETITSVLDWYLQNMEGDFVPQAYSAKTFRDKFPAILKASGRTQVVAQEVEVTPLAQEIVKSLQIKSWPKGSATQLPNIVQRSLTNYVDFLKKLDEFNSCMLEVGTLHRDGSHTESPNLKNTLALRRFVRYLKDSRLHTPKNFITVWFQDIFDQVSRWTNWNGSLEPYVFTMENGRFTAAMRDAAEDYCGDLNRWDQLLQELLNGPPVQRS